MTAIPAPARRISPLGGLRNTFTLTWRSVIKLRTNAEDLLGLSLQPIMYLVLFTYVFGGAIAGGTHKYLQFSLPGILVLSVVFATLGTGLMLNQDITGGVFDRFRSLPIARSAPRLNPLTGLRHTFTLTWRSVLKIRTNMEDLVGLSLQPIMFLLLFTYVSAAPSRTAAHTTICSTSCPGCSS